MVVCNGKVGDQKLGNENVVIEKLPIENVVTKN
jgi:hypothetical protein